MPDVEIREGFTPGSIGRIVELHGRYYYKHWRFGSFFEAKVARELADFIDRYDDAHDGFWLAMSQSRVEGSIIIDGAGADKQGGHLRWFIVSDQLRGQGIGSRLMSTAMKFCRNTGFKRVYLWTFEGLHPARCLYERAGFKLVTQQAGRQWGTKVNEQQFELLLSKNG